MDPSRSNLNRHNNLKRREKQQTIRMLSYSLKQARQLQDLTIGNLEKQHRDILSEKDSQIAILKEHIEAQDQKHKQKMADAVSEHQKREADIKQKLETNFTNFKKQQSALQSALEESKFNLINSEARIKFYQADVEKLKHQNRAQTGTIQVQEGIIRRKSAEYDELQLYSKKRLARALAKRVPTTDNALL